MDGPYCRVPKNWWVARGQDRSSNPSTERNPLCTLQWQALQERLLHATPKICHSLGSEIHHERDPWRHMWEPRWGAIPSVQGLKTRLLLANHEARLYGICLQMWQVLAICTDIKSSSGGTYIQDQPVAFCHQGNRLNWLTSQRKR